MIKKVCAVLLLVLVKIYDSYAVSYILPKAVCCLSKYSACGMGGMSAYACSIWCRNRGYNYYSIGGFSHVCGYSNNSGCACYNSSAFSSDACACSGCYVGNGIASGTPASNGVATSFSCAQCAQKVCEGTYQDYTESTQRRAWQFCSASAGGVCMESSLYYDYRCRSGYYGVAAQKQTSPITCTKCPEFYGAAATSPLGDNDTISTCFIPSGSVMEDSAGTFTFTSDCKY